MVMPDGSKIVLPDEKGKELKDAGYVGKEVCFGFRPEDLKEEAPGTPNTLHSTIRVYELLGAEVFLYFDLADINVTARVDPSTTARTGSEVYMSINMDHIHVFDKDTEEAVLNY